MNLLSTTQKPASQPKKQKRRLKQLGDTEQLEYLDNENTGLKMQAVMHLKTFNLIHRERASTLMKCALLKVSSSTHRHEAEINPGRCQKTILILDLREIVESNLCEFVIN